ncbi:MAG TPA: hypothetical protein VF771_11530, partial [Longimicrobiaceae bacterium]
MTPLARAQSRLFRSSWRNLRPRKPADLRAGILASPFVITRAQVGVSTTAMGADGTWATFAADIARFHGLGRRFLFEGQRTNGVRNPRGEGSAAGTPGTTPTNWNMAVPGGMTRETLAPVTINGIPCIPIRWSGTTAGATSVPVFESSGIFSVTSGQTFTSSAFLALSVASGGTPAISLANREFDGAAAVPVPDSSAPALALTTTLQRFSRTTTAGGTTVSAVPSLRITLAAGVAYDFTIYHAWPQIELGAFATSPILPPASSPAAATRTGDFVSAPLSAWGIGGSGACTVIAALTLTGIEPSAACFPIQIDDGTANNRQALTILGGGNVHPCRGTAG